ncbi:hypothetical protein SLEP1_g15090 [Rubroshorea leprosula]|uniref:Uncharacterized protein n=1 Tax=Rubroshorea leprosula TaxID=152421 RepID=A0AAV5IL94_9ROSI|nr:hypothetical protein SLEP1_g15090 [Rubroshorea leprosula]
MQKEPNQADNPTWKTGNPGSALSSPPAAPALWGLIALIFRPVSFPCTAGGLPPTAAPVFAAKFWFLIVLSV